MDDVYGAYLVHKSYPKGCSDVRKRQVRKMAERFSVKEGLHLFKKAGKQVQKAIASPTASLDCTVGYLQSRSEQMRVAQACHIGVTSGHFGVTITVARIKERFMWKGILKDVKSMVRFFGV